MIIVCLTSGIMIALAILLVMLPFVLASRFGNLRLPLWAAAGLELLVAGVYLFIALAFPAEIKKLHDIAPYFLIIAPGMLIVILFGYYWGKLSQRLWIKFAIKAAERSKKESKK